MKGRGIVATPPLRVLVKVSWFPPRNCLGCPWRRHLCTSVWGRMQRLSFSIGDATPHGGMYPAVVCARALLPKGYRKNSRPHSILVSQTTVVSRHDILHG